MNYKEYKEKINKEILIYKEKSKNKLKAFKLKQDEKLKKFKFQLKNGNLKKKGGEGKDEKLQYYVLLSFLEKIYNEIKELDKKEILLSILRDNAITIDNIKDKSFDEILTEVEKKIIDPFIKEKYSQKINNTDYQYINYQYIISYLYHFNIKKSVLSSLGYFNLYTLKQIINQSIGISISLGGNKRSKKRQGGFLTYDDYKKYSYLILILFLKNCERNIYEIIYTYTLFNDIEVNSFQDTDLNDLINKQKRELKTLFFYK